MNQVTSQNRPEGRDRKKSRSFSKKTNLLLLLGFVLTQIVIAIWTYFLLKSEGLI